MEDTEDEPEMMDEVEKREQELFMKYLKESPEFWQQLMDSIEYGNSMFRNLVNVQFCIYIYYLHQSLQLNITTFEDFLLHLQN